MNPLATIRAWLETEVGKVWTLEELLAEFELVNDAPQYAVVRHCTSHKTGSLWRTRDGRWYHSFTEDSAT